MTSHLCNIRFKVIYETSKPNQIVKVVGNIKELGNWDIEKAIPLYLSKVEKNVWTSSEILINKNNFLPQYNNNTSPNEEDTFTYRKKNTNEFYQSSKFLSIDENPVFSIKTNSTPYYGGKRTFTENLEYSKNSMYNTTKHKTNPRALKDFDNNNTPSANKREANYNSNSFKNKCNLEYKYVLFEIKGNTSFSNINIDEQELQESFSHWETLPNNSNHNVNIFELNFSHIVLINQKFKIYTCIDSGLKFRFNIPEKELSKSIMINNLNIDRFHMKLTLYLNKIKENKKKSAFNLKDSLSNLNELPSYYQVKKSISDIKSNLEYSKLFSSVKKENSETLFDKMYLFSHEESVRKASISTSKERKCSDCDKGSLVSNPTAREKIDTNKKIFDAIVSERDIIFASAFLPCRVFIDTSSIRYRENNNNNSSDNIIPEVEEDIGSCNKNNKKSKENTENYHSNNTNEENKKTIKFDISNDSSSDNSSRDFKNKKIDLYSLKFGISFFDDSYMSTLYNLTQSNHGSYFNNSFKWVGFLCNYFEILDQLNIKYNKRTKSYKSRNTTNYQNYNSNNNTNINTNNNVNIISNSNYHTNPEDKANHHEKERKDSYFNDEKEDEDIEIINSKIEDLLKSYNMKFFQVNYEDYINFKKAITEYLEPLMNYIKYFFTLENIKNYECSWEGYKKFNKQMADTINQLSKEFTHDNLDGTNCKKNNCSLVVIQDMYLFLTPAYLQNYSKSFKIAFWLYSNFPSIDVFKTFPNRSEILKSVLNSDLVGFNTYSSSRNFITAVHLLLNLDHCSNNNGQLLFHVNGREVLINVQCITTEKESISKLMSTKEYETLHNSLKFKLEHKKLVFVSIDPLLFLTGARHKMLAFKMFLEKIKDKKLIPKIKYIQYFYESDTYIFNANEAQLIKKNYVSVFDMGNEINKKYGIDITKVKKKKEITFIEKLALLSVSNCYLKLTRREPFNLDVYDYLVIKQIQIETLRKNENKQIILVNNNPNCKCGRNNRDIRGNQLPHNNIIHSNFSNSNSTSPSKSHHHKCNTTNLKLIGGELKSSDNKIKVKEASIPSVTSESPSSSIPRKESPAKYNSCRRLSFEELKCTFERFPNKIFSLMLTETNEASLNCALKANQFDTDQIIKNYITMYNQIAYPSENDFIKISNDIKNIEKNSILNWLMTTIITLNNISDEKKKNVIKKGYGLNMSVMKAKTKFSKLNEEDVLIKYSASYRRVIIFDAESSFISVMNPDFNYRYHHSNWNYIEDSGSFFYYPYLKLLHKLRDISKDKNNLLVIISSRSRNEMTTWFKNLDNVILIAEMGYFVWLKNVSLVKTKAKFSFNHNENFFNKVKDRVVKDLYKSKENLMYNSNIDKTKKDDKKDKIRNDESQNDEDVNVSSNTISNSSKIEYTNVRTSSKTKDIIEFNTDKTIRIDNTKEVLKMNSEYFTTDPSKLDNNEAPYFFRRESSDNEERKVNQKIRKAPTTIYDLHNYKYNVKDNDSNKEININNSKIDSQGNDLSKKRSSINSAYNSTDGIDDEACIHSKKYDDAFNSRDYNVLNINFNKINSNSIESVDKSALSESKYSNSKDFNTHATHIKSKFHKEENSNQSEVFDNDKIRNKTNYILEKEFKNNKENSHKINKDDDNGSNFSLKRDLALNTFNQSPYMDNYLLDVDKNNHINKKEYTYNNYYDKHEEITKKRDNRRNHTNLNSTYDINTDAIYNDLSYNNNFFINNKLDLKNDNNSNINNSNNYAFNNIDLNVDSDARKNSNNMNINDFSSSKWEQFIDNCNLSWIEEVAFQLKPYVERCEGSYIIQNETYLIFNYQNSDFQQALSFVKAIYNEFESPLKEINVIIENENNSLIFKVGFITKENIINFLLFSLIECDVVPQFLLVLGGDESFEGVFKSLNKFEAIYSHVNMFTCSIGQRISAARNYLTSKKDAYSVIKSISKLSIPELKSNLSKNLDKMIAFQVKRHKSCYNIKSILNAENEEPYKKGDSSKMIDFKKFDRGISDKFNTALISEELKNIRKESQNAELNYKNVLQASSFIEKDELNLTSKKYSGKKLFS